jgi:DNA polymerase I
VSAEFDALCGLPFNQVWVVDFEFRSSAGENPEPVCLVARELRSGQKHRLWRDEFGSRPPYPTDSNVLFVAYYASAEISCHLALDWPAPERVLDPFTEFRNHTNGLAPISGSGLLGALSYFGLDSIGAVEKGDMRNLVLRGGPWSEAEKVAILNYCESDVAALVRLLLSIMPYIDLPRALLRGRYMVAAARMERYGVPIDMETWQRLVRHWPGIKGQLIAAIDADYGVYDGHTFKEDRFAVYLKRHRIPWLRLESGRLDLSDDTFRAMGKAYPAIAPLRELPAALSEMRLSDLAVGKDGRNRTLLSAFRARIAAALSGDPRMMEAYRSGDPYLAFAQQAGAAPPDASRTTHKAIREQFKATVLAVQYGMGADALAQRIGKSPVHAREGCTGRPIASFGAGLTRL